MPASLTLYRITSDKALMKKFFGFKYVDFILDWKINGIKNYVRENEWASICNKCYRKVRKDPDFQKNLVKKFVKKAPLFLNFCKKLYDKK